MRDSIKKAVKIICFLAGLMIIVFYLNSVLIKKDAEAKYGEFYSEAQEYDVLFMGMSHMQFAVSPMDLWRDYGIRSFCIAEPGSRLSVSYWALKNALQYSHPKLVVLDVRRLEFEGDPTEVTHVHFDSMPFGALKINAVRDLFSSFEDRVDMLVPLTLYHDRWSELGQNDFRREERRLNKGGYGYDTNNATVCIPKKFEIIPETEKDSEYTPLVGYLEKMIRMCQEQGIEVLLVNAPYMPKSKQTQLRENGAADIAAKYHVNYLNFLHIDNVVNFNTDMRDPAHLNISGMNKVTDYLGDYLRQNYNIPDRRSESGHEEWDHDYELYLDSKFRKMGDVDAADNDLVLLADKNIDSFIYVKAGSMILKDARYCELIQNVALGGTLPGLQEAAKQGRDYLLIIDRGRSTASEYVGLPQEGEHIESFCGSVDFGFDDIDGPYLKINDPETNYLTDGPDIQMIAVNAGTGTVENVGRFNVITERTD